MDRNGVLARVVDSSGNVAVTAVAGTPESASKVADHDENWVWDRVFDAATNTIRVMVV